tara:strand:+ start:1004 stop:1312 length:309 start_codon:yes stop_codon:yes gene_type:complete
MNIELLNKVKYEVNDEANYAVKDCNGHYQQIYFNEDKWFWCEDKNEPINTSTLLVLEWDDDDDDDIDFSLFPYEGWEEAQDLLLRQNELHDPVCVGGEFPKY